MSYPGALTAGADGNLWFSEAAQKGAQIGRITPAGDIAEFPLPSTHTSSAALTLGPDGNLWFPEITQQNGVIGRITPAGYITEFPLPAGGFVFDALTVGPDGNLWFPDHSSRIGRITPSGAITEFPLPSANSFPGTLTAGADGNLWFSEVAQIGRIGRITPTGAITEFPLSSTGTYLALTAGADGNLWFSEGAQIGRITPTGDIAEFPLPSTHSSSAALTLGPDGNLWFPEVAQQIGRITPAGAITEFPLPSANVSAGTFTVGPDGNLYLSENSYEHVYAPHAGLTTIPTGTTIGGVTPTGDLVEIPGTTGVMAGALTVGPDGNLWFAEEGSPGGPGIVGRVNLQNLIATAVTFATTAGVTYSGTVATFIDADSGNAHGNYSAAIDWGDGSSIASGIITADGNGGYIVSGTHTYATSGARAVTVTINDIDRGHTIARSTAKVDMPLSVPRIADIVSVTHSPKGITAIVLGFNEALNPSSAGNVHSYSLASGVKKRHKLVFSKGVKIGGVTYDVTAHAVTLRLSKPTKGAIQVTAHGGIMATNGASSRGDFTAVVK